MHRYNIYFIHMLRAQVIYYLQDIGCRFCLLHRIFYTMQYNIIMLKINT